MNKKEFVLIRKMLDKTQKQIANLLGTSIKAVHSYEQGLRSIPFHVERQLYFLVFQFIKKNNEKKFCWEIKNCPKEIIKLCPAYEFNCGHICWFINGTICEGKTQKNWKEKIEICKSCEVFKIFFIEFYPTL
ncbi:MAG: helix-turn-helix transcriptional regulator [Desulfobacterales bacterium]|nr:helix-turn-helix transcriptional regulator [Desulfobacterales bacterium]